MRSWGMISTAHKKSIRILDIGGGAAAVATVGVYALNANDMAAPAVFIVDVHTAQPEVCRLRFSP